MTTPDPSYVNPDTGLVYDGEACLQEQQSQMNSIASAMMLIGGVMVGVVGAVCLVTLCGTGLVVRITGGVVIGTVGTALSWAFGGSGGYNVFSTILYGGCVDDGTGICDDGTDDQTYIDDFDYALDM